VYMPTENALHPPIPQATDTRFYFGNLSGASTGLVLSQFIQMSTRPVLIITPTTQMAQQLEFEIKFFQPDIPLIDFPDWETLPYDQFSPHQDIISRRLSALSRIPSLEKGAIISTIATLMHRLPPTEFLASHIFLWKQGDRFSIQSNRYHLEKAGYRMVEAVREHGECAIRGSIIDVFPMGSELPFRLDLLGDEIDSIRIFSPDTQRTLEHITEIAILPAKEFPLTDAAIERFRQSWRSQFSGNPLNCPMYQDISEGICTPGIEYYHPFFFENTATFFDYVPKNCISIRLEELENKADEFWQEITTRFDQRAHDLTRPLLKPDQLFLPVPTLFSHLKAYSEVKLKSTPWDKEDTHHFNFATKMPQAFPIDRKASEPLLALNTFRQQYSGRILFCAETEGRREVLLQLFRGIQLYPIVFDTWEAFLKSEAKEGIIVAPFDEGLEMVTPPLLLIAESQLFGQRIMQRRRRKETSEDLETIVKDLTELQEGDPIVHIDHGVGRYRGLQTLTIGEQLTEFLCLEYEGGDKLYVPVSSLHLISRYSGTDPDHAPLHKLGTEHWQRAKKKAAEQVKDVAAELLDINAKRAAQKGFAYQETNGHLLTFAEAFPFEETPDQTRAIEQVIHDMMDEKPMDRLICGDVGFGKTEVAMRAAFFAVQNGKQAAMLVPTTLLAEQHFQTFQDRFADWPIRIASLSRFRSQKEMQKIATELSEGKIDIVIGTHKLLQDTIQFKSLGLLIIDEEHRFGVQQKERLKALRLNIDILTLTATPIPRTLNMAFSGIRDLSLIATPPLKRLSIKTFVYEMHSSIIQEGILREIMRGGQVYFLHNEVSSIDKIAHDLQKWVPEARIGIAHGQMRERELEQVMVDFYHRRFNVLVATTIIESGIDIPSANTIIIHRADKFGLAQLHQLRGRVGRSHHQAYAYLLIPPRKMLTSDAIKRLEAITAYENLGIGFTLATHDLEIRGAGELLGKNQSGQMQEVGFSLYMELLSKAVHSLKSGQNPNFETINNQGTEIELQIPALIPAAYLGDVHLRLQCYKRIASAKSENELDEIQVEMIDRFGLLPDAAKNLFYLNALKRRAEQLGITKIEANSKGGKLEFNDKPSIDPMHLIQLIQTESHRYKLEGSHRLRFTLEPHDAKERMQKIEQLLDKIQPI